MFHWLAPLFRLPAAKSRPRSIGDSNDEVIYELPYEVGGRFRVLQGYGGAYSHTGDSYYSIDFRMPEGTPICASRGGVVYRVINHFADGGAHASYKPKANAIYILHPDDSIAAYVHLMHLGNCVVAGDAVSTGQIIGYSGNTGWSGTPHVHFHVADAVHHQQFATKFNTVECGRTTVNVETWYTRPNSQLRVPASRIRRGELLESNMERDAFAFSPELIQLADDVAGDLELAGFNAMSEYSSIDPVHDVHGLEICGIQSANDTVEITRFLLRRFPGWNAGWIHAPDDSSSQGWVARIQRDRDTVVEYWDTD